MIALEQYRQSIGTFVVHIQKILQRKHNYIGKRCRYNNGLVTKYDKRSPLIWVFILVAILFATSCIVTHLCTQHHIQQGNMKNTHTTVLQQSNWIVEHKTVIVSIACGMTNSTDINVSVPLCLRLIDTLLIIGGIEINPGPNWLMILQGMQRCQTFDELDNFIRHINLSPIPAFVGNCYKMNYSCDNIAQSYIPSDITRQHVWMAVKTTGNGSCFFNALSRMVYGHEQNALEMRVRIILEGIRNRHLYLNDAYLSRGLTTILNLSTRYCLYSASYIDNVRYSPLIVAQTYLNELLNLTKPTTWCGIWQFHQAANMLQCKIYSIYPEIALNIRNDLNRNILPATYDDNVEQLFIMWTPSLLNSITVNHFVPLVR
jgi:hypothetical protein